MYDVKKSIITLLSVVFVACAIMVDVQAHHDGSHYKAEYVSNYDGDTITLKVEVWRFPPITTKVIVRLDGVDTPELRGSCFKEKFLAKMARRFVRLELSSAKDIDLQAMSRGKYGRIIGHITYDGKSLAEELINKGYGRGYDGGAREPWCQKKAPPK